MTKRSVLPTGLLLVLLAPICAQAGPTLSDREATRLIESVSREMGQPMQIPMGRFQIAENTNGNVAIDFQSRIIKQNAGVVDNLPRWAGQGFIRYEFSTSDGRQAREASLGNYVNISPASTGETIAKSRGGTINSQHLLIPTCQHKLQRLVQVYTHDKGPDTMAALYWTQTESCSEDYNRFRQQLGYVVSDKPRQCSGISRHDRFESTWRGITWLSCSEPGQPLSVDHVKRVLKE